MGEYFFLVLYVKAVLNGQVITFSFSADVGGAFMRVAHLLHRTVDYFQFTDWARYPGYSVPKHGSFIMEEWNTPQDQEHAQCIWEEDARIAEQIKELFRMAEQFGVSGWTAEEMWSYDWLHEPSMRLIDVGSGQTAGMKIRTRRAGRGSEFVVKANYGAVSRGCRHANAKAKR